MISVMRYTGPLMHSAINLFAVKESSRRHFAAMFSSGHTTGDEWADRVLTTSFHHEQFIWVNLTQVP